MIGQTESPEQPMPESFSQRTLAWYDRHGRKQLPWQNPITPYRVWVSEIMLQQTQVNTVIPYFLRFMERFPDVFTLAEAALDEVLHLWTGLGYYARGRNLHKCAQVIAEHHNGFFPTDAEVLACLPGIGRSTAAAISSIAFNQPDAILDGNVKRLLARHAAVQGWPGDTKVSRQLWCAAQQRMPATRCREYTQAMMDLGALICTRTRPKCGECPLAVDCQALARDLVNALPGARPKKIKPVKQALMLVIQSPRGGILLQQRPPQGIWGGLWSLPELPVDSDVDEHVVARFGEIRGRWTWPGFRHSFTHYHFDIQPVHVCLTRHPRAVQEPDHLWYHLDRPADLGLAAPVKTLLARLRSETPEQEALPL